MSVRRTVLVVHAAPDWAARVAARLDADGWSTETLEGGERALDRYVQEPSDAVVVDLDLRGRDGAATIESLRWAPGGRALPIVLTGIAAARAELEALGRELRVETVASGDPEQIAQVLARLLPPRPSERSPEADRPVERATTPGSGTFEVDGRDTKPHDLAPLDAEAAALVSGGAAAREALDAAGFDDDLYTSEPPRLPTVPPPSRDPQGGREGVDVERRAKALAEVADVVGRLEELEVGFVLARLADLRATGALVVEHDGRAPTTTGESPKRVVFFRNGVPVHVRSNLEEECLGQLLLRRGVIDRAVLEESITRVRDGDGRQGGILVAMGALTPRELREALEQQQEAKLLGLFAWRAGAFRFSDAMTPPAETITLELSLAEIVARALRTHVPSDVLETANAPFLDRFVWASEVGWRGLAQVLEDDERAMLDAIDGHATLRTLLERFASQRAAALRAFHAARCLGSVAFREVALDRGPAGERSAHASKRLRALLTALRAERYGEVFEVSAETDVPTLRRRGAALRAEARRLREDVPIALHPLSDELHHRLGRAEAVLVAERERTDSETVLPPVPTSKARPSGRGGSSAEALSTSSASQEADEHLPLGAESSQEAVTRELPAAMEIPARPVRTGDVPLPDAGAPDATREVPSPASTSAPSSQVSELDARVERMLQAERAMRRARRSVDRGQLATAREAIERAVELVPDEPEFAAELAWVDAKASSDEAARRASLKRLDELTRLAPKNARIHVLRAELLLDAGAEADAKASYERALAANPDDPKALAGLRALIR